MKINYSWLQDYLPITAGVEQLGRDLTLVGLALEGIDSREGDSILDLEIASNRGDCLCHAGVAREASAIYDLSLKLPECGIPPPDGDVIPYSVEILKPRLCRRYCALLLTGVRVGPSPGWLQQRLLSVGQRPINSIVDATNYVMLELGQPLHAFDLDRLGPKIVVRTAQRGERLRTLDGFEQELDPAMLVIADDRRAVALAGVMGGEESEISTTASRVLLESAHFDPVSVRRTARRLGLRTEASHRFERGADIENAARAIGRCARLIREIAGGRVASALLDNYPGRHKPRVVTFRPKSLAQLAGVEVGAEECAASLAALGFDVERRRATSWRVTVPSFRGDVEFEADLVEEVARHHGYDHIPSTHNSWKGLSELPPGAQTARLGREILRGFGYSEAVNTSFATDRELEIFPGDGEPAPVKNPLSEEETRLRWHMVPLLLRNCRHNLNHGVRDVRLFEVSRVFRLVEGAVLEQARLGLVLTGAASPANWAEKPDPCTFFHLKGHVDALMAGVRAAEPEFREERVPSYLDPQLALSLWVGGRPAGHLGRIGAAVEEAYKFRQPVFVADIDARILFPAAAPDARFRPLPRYPVVQRDISFVVDRSVQYNTVESVLRDSGIPALQDVELFDLYRLQGREDGNLSLSVRLTYRSEERTLTLEEVNEFDRRLIRLLEQKVGATLRS